MSASSSESSAIGQEEIPASSPLSYHHALIVFLGSKTSGESPPEAKRIVIDRDSKFKDIKEELAAENLDHWTLLQSHYTSPIPYWSESDPNASISIETQTIYAINTNGREYVLGVVRTSDADTPLLILDPKTTQTVRQAVLMDLALVDVKSITLYSGTLDVGGDLLDCRTLRETELVSFPTALCITVGEAPGQLELDMSLESVFTYLQCSYIRSFDLLRESFRLKCFSLQMAHVSNCLVHILVSLTRALGPPESRPGPRATIDDWTDLSALDLFQIAPLLTRILDLYIADLRGYMSSIANAEFDHDDIQRNIDQVFLTLCGEYPGAVTVRHSHKHFEQLKEIDWERIASQRADGLKLANLKTPHPSADTEDESDHSLSPPQGQWTDQDPMGHQSSSEYPSNKDWSKHKGPNNSKPESHRAGDSGMIADGPPIMAQDEVREVLPEDPNVGGPKIE